VTNPYGCSPTGRVINQVITLDPGEQQTITVNVPISCADVAGATGQTFTLIGVVDVHADDAGACAPGQLMSMACYNALADDDDDDADNRVVTNAFRVK
jgi:xanthine dehydrogenase iron-sulfur cluster and FAD-binding subunit A